jgi:hypothetical protein
MKRSRLFGGDGCAGDKGMMRHLLIAPFNVDVYDDGFAEETGNGSDTKKILLTK